MADLSTYKGLELPKSDDRYNIEVFNQNSMIIDSELHKLDLKNQSQDDLLATKEALNSETARVTAHISDTANPHAVTKEQLHLSNVDNTSDIDKPVSTAQQAALNAYYQQSTGYTDQKIADLIGGAPSTLDTLGEIADAMSDNQDVVAALNTAIGTKANQAEMESLLGTKLDTTGDSKDNKVTFAGSDTLTPSGWTEVAVLNSGETHKSILAKISSMFRNIRFMWNLLYAISACGAIMEVQIVNALPSDAASHPTTFYWVKG